MNICYHKLTAEHGTFLLIGTEAQAREFSKPYTVKGAMLETWLNLGYHVLLREELKQFNKAIIL